MRSFCQRSDEHLLQLGAGEGVEHAEGLIEQEHLGREGEGAGDAAALAHALRKLGGFLVHGVAKADDRKVILDDLAAFRGIGGVVDLFDAEHDVLEGGEPGQEAGGLEDNAAVGAGAGDFLAGEHDAATRYVSEAGDHGEDRGLAAARVADEGDELALLDTQVEVLDDDRLALGRGVDFAELGNFEEGGHYISSG